MSRGRGWRGAVVVLLLLLLLLLGLGVGAGWWACRDGSSPSAENAPPAAVKTMTVAVSAAPL